MLAGDRFGERAAEAGVGAGVAVDFACEGSEGICGRASAYHHRSMVLNEKRMDSPLVGWRQARAASSSMRPLRLARVGGRSEQRADDLKA